MQRQEDDGGHILEVCEFIILCCVDIFEFNLFDKYTV